MDWDNYFINIAKEVSRKSHCLSHQFGAVAVRDNHILSTGYNGPPSGYPHCEGKYIIVLGKKFTEGGLVCPRHALGYKSGQGLELCPAAHAELNVIVQAARYGINLNGATLYITSPTPCRECSKAIVNAGIYEVVTGNANNYPDIGLTGDSILERCGVRLRIVLPDSRQS